MQQATNFLSHIHPRLSLLLKGDFRSLIPCEETFISREGWG
jgi:hypothetical protein